MEAIPPIVRELDHRIGPYNRSRGGEEFLFKCVFPSCTDRKKHLSVNPFKQAKDSTKGVYRCWKCGNKGSLNYLLKFVGITVVEGVGGYDLTEYEQAIAKLRGETAPVKTERVDYALEPGTEYWPTVPEYSEAWRYLVGTRQMDPRVLRLHQFGIGMGKYRNRIILPEIEDERMVFWQARSYTGRKPKYVRPVGERDHHIWNFARVRELYEEVRIAEGIFSGLACGVQGVGTYSYNYLPGQVELLAGANFKKYVIVFDGRLDAYSAADRLAQDLISFCIDEDRIYIVPLPLGYDPDDLGAVMMNTYIERAIRWSPGWIPHFIMGGELLCPDVKTSANCQNGQKL
jgi:hypothetical protein